MHWLHFLYLAAVILLLDLSYVVGGPKPKARCPPRVLKGGRVRIRNGGRQLKYVCVRGYQLLGTKYSNCVRGRWDTPAPVCIKDGCDAFNVPNGQVLETYQGAYASVHCDPGYLLVGNQGLYCNGAVWNDTLPICREIGGSAQKECDFESEDLCGWSDDTNQDFNWKRHNFATPSGHVGTGPSFDHTLGKGLNGHYMYLETSTPRLQNDTARLNSPVFRVPTNETSCFKFWYHMFGQTTGSLNVYFHGKDSELLFSKSGNHGDQWQLAVLPLPILNSSFQILIEGVRGAGYEGDIAIDDVKLASGEECSLVTATSDVTRTLEDISCENRCFSATTDPSLCECTMDCIANNTCCPDFLQYCSATTEATEWLSSQSETETETMDEISISMTPESETIFITISNQNESTNVKESVTKGFDVNTMKAHNSTLPMEYLLTTSPNTVLLSTNHSTASTSITTNEKFITLNPQINNTFVKNVTTSTSSHTQNIFKTFSYSTVPTVNTSTLSHYVFSSKSSNTLPPVISTTTSTNYQLHQNTSESIQPKRPDTKQTITLKSVTEKRNDSFPTELHSTTQSYTQNDLLEQTKLKSINQTTKETTVSMKDKIRTGRRRPFILRPFKTISSTIQTYPRNSIYTKPTKKLFTTTSSSVKTHEIIFNTPPPSVMFRTPKSTVDNSINYYTTPLYPKFKKNSNKKEIKSRNDILYHGWNKSNSTIPVTTLRSTSSQFATQSTTTSSDLLSTVVNFDYENGVKSNRKSKHNHSNTDSPNLASLTSTSTNEGYTFVWISFVLLMLSTVLVSVCLVKRRRRNRRTREDDELDIEFLPSDEMLDFTLSRPDISEEGTL